MPDPYLLLSKSEPAATPANPLHSLIDLKGQCGLLRAWEQPSIFYHFLLRLRTGAHLPFVSWSVGITGLRQHIYVSFFLKAALLSAAACSHLVCRSRTAWSERSRCTLTSPHFLLHCSKAVLSENRRKGGPISVEKAHSCQNWLLKDK